MSRWIAAAAVVAGVLATPTGARAEEADFVPGEVLVLYHGKAAEEIVDLPEDVAVAEAVDRLAKRPEVAYAVPNYVATASQFPDDPGAVGDPGGWRSDQWNFLEAPGVGAEAAWQNLLAAGHQGGQGITVAVIDTGIAYRDRGSRFRKSPDLAGVRFPQPRDFVEDDALPLDESYDGHGTHVASTVAQTTDNGLGLTGLAYGVRVMPVRVLNRNRVGSAANVAKGISYAARHGADVINLSLQFGGAVDRCEDVPGVCRAIRRAVRRKDVVVVAAAGNGTLSGRSPVSYPAAAPRVIGVGASTVDGCLAQYSNFGEGLDLVAPGGGLDRAGLSCGPGGGRRVRQFSLKPTDRHFRRFGFLGMEGTSMAAAHASATAALVLASGVLGPAPAPAQVGAQLRCSAQTVSDPEHFGAGRLDAGQATTADCTG